MNLKIDQQIMNSDRAICRHIDSKGLFSVGEISQDILAQLRHFVEHIMLKVYANGNDIEDSQENIKKARNFIKGYARFRFLGHFHSLLEISAPHRTLAEENAKRLMIKYYEYLLKIKKYLYDKYSMAVLYNIEKFPIEVDGTYKEYYERIAERIDKYKCLNKNEFYLDRFYVLSKKPFFVNGKIYYEVAFVPANDRASKTDCIMAFTEIEISDYYAVKLSIVNDSISIFNKTMPFRIIVGYEVNIRPCEFKNISKIIFNCEISISKIEQDNLSKYLTTTGSNLVEMIDCSEADFIKLCNIIAANSKNSFLHDIISRCRELVKNKSKGCNVLRILLFHMRNKVIKSQYYQHWDKANCKYIGNNYLSGLYLNNKCIPFDDMPFCSELKDHITNIIDKYECFDASEREYEILAWIVKNNTEQKGILFTALERNDGVNYHRFMHFENVEELVEIYNNKLYNSPIQQSRKLIIKNDYIFIEGYKNDTVYIINKIIELTKNGVDNYSKSVEYWINNQDNSDVSEEKKNALVKMFDKSKVGLVYGAAGTGKTTFINYLSKYFKNHTRLYLAHTNPAINNLKRKVDATLRCEFMTITKFCSAKDIKRDYDIIIIDECSTVSNQNMKELLELVEFELLVLVGDTYQIEAIQFGNWFSAVRQFVPDTSICELNKEQFRTDSKQLLGLWDSVRNMSGSVIDNDVLDRLQGGEFSTNLDETIFEPAEKNEIILCLNYGGLYGINNINHFMQENNNNKAIYRGIQRYKVGDPILFNDISDMFFTNEKEKTPIIHNNMKGKIVDFRMLRGGKLDEAIQFDIELDKPVMELKSDNYNFEIIGNNQDGNSIIRFEVLKNKSTDEDDDVSKNIVPFQIAYAVSIHKAQGLEFDSVKIVITEEIDELISHSIFYTAITRAKKKLKIYWNQSVEQNILERIKPLNNRQDISILKNEIYEK